MSPHCRTQFKEISAAYEVLSDPDKRQLYDEYGEDALKDGGGMGGMGGGANPFDIFENLFGGNPFGGGARATILLARPCSCACADSSALQVGGAGVAGGARERMLCIL